MPPKPISTRFAARHLPWRRCLWALVSIALLSGCVSKKTAEQRQRAAFLAGRQQAVIDRQQQHIGRQSEAREPTVTLSGPVKHTSIGWSPGLTLAGAILAADYQNRRHPRSIIIHRAGERWEIKGWQLMSGNDVDLEPGDRIELIP